MGSHDNDKSAIAAWFAGPKAEQGDWFGQTILRIIQDYHSWRRNYFPEDGVVVDSALKRRNESFHDAFEDRLIELLARLKGDFPFQSPRYAAHMVAEQTLPAIAGYIAAMLYNPNNVSNEAAPVTVRLELEAAQLIARMLGYGPDCWAHLTGGGTIANIEALWVARTVRYLPLVVTDMRVTLGLTREAWSGDRRAMLGMSPAGALAEFSKVFIDAGATPGAGDAVTTRVIRAYLDSPHNVVERGLDEVCGSMGSRPAVLVPETHHYCFEKAADALGLGRRALVSVRVDGDFRMVVKDLEARLDEVEKSGRHVIAVVGVVGTTEEGAVDPIDGILAMRERREKAGLGSFWLHADAAYGGYLRTMTVPGRMGLGEAQSEVKVRGQVRTIALKLPEHSACDALERLGECDSITIDPHKLGYIPYPAGAICFRSSVVKPLMRQDAPYLADEPADAESERRSQGIGMYILEGSKPGATAAAVWLSHTLIPLTNAGHGLLVQETVRNASELHALLEGYPEWVGGPAVRAVCLCDPGSNIVCYAFRPASGKATLGQVNTLNRAVYERLTLSAGERVYDQRFFVSRTVMRARGYSAETVGGFLGRLGVEAAEYEREGLFLLRSVLMNPWYGQAKRLGRYFLSELTEELYTAAAEEWGRVGRG